MFWQNLSFAVFITELLNICYIYINNIDIYLISNKKAILCDKSKQAIQIINKNVEKLRYKEKVEVLCMDYENYLNSTKEHFDYIYIDPPYNTNYISNSIKIINDKNLLTEKGIIIAETDEKERIEEEIRKLNISINIYDTRRYGRAWLIFMRKE